MIVDKILERKNAEEHGEFNYNPHDFFWYCNEWEGDLPEALDIVRAMDELEEPDVKDALCLYIIHQEYSLDIIDFIMSHKWLTKD